MPQPRAKKPVSISAITVSITEASKKVEPKIQERYELQQLLCIHYLAQFIEFPVEAFINSGSKDNVMQPSFVKKLGLYIHKIDLDAQKINGRRLKTYKMIIALFPVDDKDEKSCFIEITFILADICIYIAFGMFFLILSNIEINFNN